MIDHHHITAGEFFDRFTPAIVVNGAAIGVSLAQEIESWLRILSLIMAVTYTGILIIKATRKPPTL